MKKRIINYNWPATLSFSAENNNENEMFSRGKLKVFYKGETADHRYFSDSFAQQLVKTLPYTPIGRFCWTRYRTSDLRYRRPLY